MNVVSGIGDCPLELQRKQHIHKLNRNVEREVTLMEEENMNSEEHMGDQAKAWLQENLRVIVSFVIVAAIALGIYSYSQRTDQTVNTNSDEELSTTVNTDADTTDTITGTDTSKTTTSGTEVTPVKNQDLSQETANAFVETASKGDGTTHLARRALMDYLEKTPDSSLTGAHKVYIEDYLRKQGKPKSVVPGQSVEFSKDLIRQAIERSKNLNERQLQYLQKYAQRVAAYRS